MPILRYVYFICFSLAVFHFPAAVADNCREQATSALEQLYCQIKERDPHALGFSFKEFQKNPARTQHLLLRRPAKRLGLAMPIEPPANRGPSINRERSTDPQPSPPAPQAPSFNAAPKTQSPPAMTKPSAPQAQTAPIDKNRCELRDRLIDCQTIVFQLIDNQPNSALATEALKNNQLHLPKYNDNQSLQAYLGEAYGSYIEKMTGIGLAGSTMSYTRFFHTYQMVQEGEGDFRQRMTDMFEYLKKDKASMAIKARYTSALPAEIQQCYPLGQKFMICDDVQHNWVFRRLDI